MNKVLITLVSVFAFTNVALADGFEGELGYVHVLPEDDISLGGIYAAAGYAWNHTEDYRSVAEVLVTFGVLDDKADGITFDLEPSYAVGYKGIARLNDEVEFFMRAHYAKFEVKGSADFGFGDFSVDVGESGFGLGIGVEWKKLTVGITTYFGDLDGIDTLNIGYKF